jgi:hypothetical protein
MIFKPKQMRTYKFLTIKEQNFILANYDVYDNKELAQILNVPNTSVRSLLRRNGILRVQGNGRFRKNQPAWNRGIKGLQIGGKETRFKKGQLPHNTKEIGSQRINKDGNIEIKVEINKWVSLHSYLYTQKHEIPKGHIVVFKENVNKHNFTIEDLELISRGENAKRNKRKSLDKKLNNQNK